MEHANPILLGNNSPQKFITIGEVMLRLTPPNYEKIRMASSFEASYGGSWGSPPCWKGSSACSVHRCSAASGWRFCPESCWAPH